ncbi:aldehyde ferredoxin oxidoreductase [Desulfallas sp. Bu1-1]|uniref:aldehyde ferredoxin oxidoreductase family protein n=1 Tax=Desulfallas sp. Bu1-1 TaxID=2787620 RepID=UPI0018A0BB0F|nr:aldehyde ferredoxin oxidoreductase C-terminal domain-containing protein [Desulfallas sp. Bu1-1]MBF7082575.1 aldehyde ferredoxin oxidoreductase [Desulfallas sp. Bu1-1]
MDKIVRVNMSDRKISIEELPAEFQGLGGRGLTSAIIAKEVPPACHPLGESNKLVFAPGLLTGTRAPSSGRLSVGGKSPLTGGIKESNAGGITPQKLANLGIRALIIEGKPKDDGIYLLHLNEGGAELVPAPELKGLGTYEVNHKLRQKYGKNAGIICIGPAGEMLMAGAGVSTNDMEGHPGRYAGRGGLGAVMGSKKLKAIVINCSTTFDVPVKNKQKFESAAKKFTEIIRNHPLTSQALPAFGTAALVNVINEAGALPTRNFKYGRFERASETGGEKIAEIVGKRGGKGKMGHQCHPGCVIHCSNIYPDEKGEVLCAPVEYESVWALGANCEIDNIDQIAELNRLCNDIGLDTIETGAALAVAMEAGVISFGDGQGAIQLLKEARKGSPMGRIIGHGAAITGKIFGITRVPVVKGQALAAYDPRAVKGIGVTYATSPMGADHTAGYSVAANVLKVGGFVEPLGTEGQVELSRDLQIATAAVDCTGLCLFVAFPVLDDPEGLPAVIEMINAMYGVNLTGDDVVALGKQVLKTEREFNLAAGLGRSSDDLPEFLRREPVTTHNTVFDINKDELDKLFNF